MSADLVLYVAEPASVPRVGASPPSWMCEALLVAKGLPFRRVGLSFADGEHKSEAMLARNPRGTIPVLSHGDAIVHETFAILLYVEMLAPGHLPEGREARARALTRLFEAEHLKTAGMKALAAVMRGAADVTEHAGEIGAELDRWEDALGGDYLAGDAPSLADFVVHAYVATFARLGLSLAQWPRVAAHGRRMASLDAFATTR